MPLYPLFNLLTNNKDSNDFASGIPKDPDTDAKITVENNGDEQCKQKKYPALCWAKKKAQNACSKKELYKKFPIFVWLPRYDLETGVSDLIAGITVGLTAIPQGIAYALVANMPPQYGLYSAFMGCFVYIFLGSSKDITVGPTAIMSLLTAQYASKGPDYVVLLTFLSGLIVTLLGFLKLGFVIDFISVPVTAGFTSAAAITIASGQVKSIFGLEIKHKSHEEGLAGTWKEVFDNIESARLEDSILGIFCIIVLLLMRELKNVKWFDKPSESPTKTQLFCQPLFCGNETMRKVLSRSIWVISTARNAIVVIIFTAVSYCIDPDLPEEATRNTTFILTGNIKSGLPPFQPPPFSHNDTTTGQLVDFEGMVTELGPALIIIPLLAILENVAIAKAFAGGKPVDASQEMIALGACNILGSFVSSMPTTGSFSRTAVNAASGVKTTLGGVYTGALVVMALAVLMPFCAFIPKASLAAVIITAVIFSVEYEVIMPMWRSKKIDLIPAFATFLCCLFWGLEYGILVGVAIQVMVILYQSARPNITAKLDEVEPRSQFIFVSLDRALLFPAVSFVRHQINKAAIGVGKAQLPVVLDCSHISDADFTAAEGFKSMISDFGKRNQAVIFFNVSAKVEATFQGAKIKNFIVVHSLDEMHEQIKTLTAHDIEETVDDEKHPNQEPGCAQDNEESRQP